MHVLLQTAVICYGPVVAMETVQVALNPYQAFQMQSIHKDWGPGLQKILGKFARLAEVLPKSVS